MILAWIVWAVTGTAGLFWIWLSWRLDRMEFMFRISSTPVGGS